MTLRSTLLSLSEMTRMAQCLRTSRVLQRYLDGELDDAHRGAGRGAPRGVPPMRPARRDLPGHQAGPAFRQPRRRRSRAAPAARVQPGPRRHRRTPTGRMTGHTCRGGAPSLAQGRDSCTRVRPSNTASMTWTAESSNRPVRWAWCRSSAWVPAGSPPPIGRSLGRQCEERGGVVASIRVDEQQDFVPGPQCGVGPDMERRPVASATLAAAAAVQKRQNGLFSRPGPSPRPSSPSTASTRHPSEARPLPGAIRSETL